jgi:hypothetical protein
MEHRLRSTFQRGLSVWFEIKVDAQQGLPGDPATGNRRKEKHNVRLIVS